MAKPFSPSQRVNHSRYEFAYLFIDGILFCPAGIFQFSRLLIGFSLALPFVGFKDVVDIWLQRLLIIVETRKERG
jgi:hypothetical protein